ncbi:hypothetical protein Zmor_014590 [Zophobas morio]|uniref:Uncharacterized protein n=1 Tax=Zophobas morio TaxID=2755281 RepID=A0AA38II97_9CUCU|nr:hypothetical protein Zmor_020587 [Zophobas morio]KAJ3655459.1 hypothetical protein Zmor_014590 [Zophobas morio]
MPKPLHKDVKQMDDNLVDYFAKERDSGGPLLPLTAVQDRVAAALGVCVRTVNSVVQQIKTGEGVHSPKK